MKETISKKQLRDFGLIFGFGLPLLIGWLLPAIVGHAFKTWTLLFGMLALIIGISSPRLLYYPYQVWVALGEALGWINSRIILGLVFLIILQPIAFVMRLIGYDPLRNRRKGEKSYRENRKDHQVDLTRIF